GVTFAINLLPLLLRGPTRPRMVTNFHELYIPMTGSPQRIAGSLWQRAMAVVTAYGSDSVSATCSEWERRLRRVGVFRPVQVTPVGSNIPRVTVSDRERLAMRKQLLGEPEGLLVAGFGALHDRDVSLALEAVAALGRRRRAKLVWIGG